MDNIVIEKPPVAVWPAAKSLATCAVTTAVLLAQRRIHLPRAMAGRRIRFADGTTASVYRETVVDRGPTGDPAVLVVCFRLVVVRGRGHALFRLESILNTPLFVGFPGYVSKLWMTHDSRGTYRGIYEWDGPALAENYARTLWRVLALVCVRGSIHYRVLPGIRRDDFLRNPDAVAEAVGAAGDRAWWLPAQPVLSEAVPAVPGPTVPGPTVPRQNPPGQTAARQNPHGPAAPQQTTPGPART
ncbi:hypothetical protein SAMN05216282_101127 [Cryobacterium psychrotolerans]|uniref:Uncharacterized protein n=1 Tax=Cryobacterium psychrotolerans TaxID=386301 RepID=A0A1G8X8B4_9MICO|nr:hypothetical protein [Cryobacterium psychrotolerans]SDJ86929.1 hypothetical protein SAMN05216282_101127 [Cryobacterium psychrotolerans]